MSQDFQKMMMQAQKSIQKAQRDMQRMQQELAGTILEGTAGGGAVKITCNGKFGYTEVKSSKDAVDPADVETLEDLVLAAVKDVAAKVQELNEKKTQNLT